MWLFKGSARRDLGVGRDGFISLFFLLVALFASAILAWEAAQIYSSTRVDRKKITEARLSRVGRALLAYASIPCNSGGGVRNRFPNSLNVLASEGFLSPLDLRDAWGQAFVYHVYGNPSSEGACISVYPASQDLSDYPVAVVVSKGENRTEDTTIDSSSPASASPGGDDSLVIVSLKDLADSELAGTESKMRDMATVAVNEWMRGYYKYCVWRQEGDTGYNEYCGTGNEEKLWPQTLDDLMAAGGFSSEDVEDAGGNTISYEVTGDEEVTFTATCPFGYILKRDVPSEVKP